MDASLASRLGKVELVGIVKKVQVVDYSKLRIIVEVVEMLDTATRRVTVDTFEFRITVDVVEIDTTSNGQWSNWSQWSSWSPAITHSHLHDGIDPFYP